MTIIRVNGSLRATPWGGSFVFQLLGSEIFIVTESVVRVLQLQRSGIFIDTNAILQVFQLRRSEIFIDRKVIK